MAEGLKELPNAIIAPHIASATIWTREGMVTSRRREFCHFADIPSPSLLKRLVKVEGGAAE